MISPILTTKLFIPKVKQKAVMRNRLTQRLNEGLDRKLTLLSASAGYGKTSLISEWITCSNLPAAWLSLDEGDNDIYRFLAYICAALQTIDEKLPSYARGLLQSPQPPPAEPVLTALINELAKYPARCVLVLDDYHLIHSKAVHHAVSFLLDYLPPNAHLVIASREEPDIPLTRLRVGDEVTELGVPDLRFNHSESAAYLNESMKLQLTSQEISDLENRTEGWIAALQFAAVSIEGYQGSDSFMKAFAGNQRVLLDFLVEEVLNKQPETTRQFLLYTSILDRMCEPLCSAVLSKEPSESGSRLLQSLERANLFIVSMDDEQTWYRYHHLFAESLRRLLRNDAASRIGRVNAAELHLRASRWFEDNGFPMDAFRHAVAANATDLAERLAYGGGMPLHLRGEVAPVLSWLESLPLAELDARPSLWVIFASASLLAGRAEEIESKLQAAEKAMKSYEMDGKTRNLIGLIAATRASVSAMTVAASPTYAERRRLETIELSKHLTDDKTNEIVGRIPAMPAASPMSSQQTDRLIELCRRALEHLNPELLPVRMTAVWLMGVAYQHRGERGKAQEAFAEVLSISRKLENNIIGVMAVLGQASLFEGENLLYEAEAHYRRALELAGEQPSPAVCEAYLGLARIHYERNDLEKAMQLTQMGAQLARRLQHSDFILASEIFIARLKLAYRDYAGASALLGEAKPFARERSLTNRLPDIAAVQALLLLRQGDPVGALHEAKTHELPLCLARAYLAHGDAAAALAAIAPYSSPVTANGQEDQRLEAMLLEAAARCTLGQRSRALEILIEALEIAERGGFIRSFIDAETPVLSLLSVAKAYRKMPGYLDKLLLAMEQDKMKEGASQRPEPLTARELEVLQLAAQGLSNKQIGDKLFVALDTVKGHHRRIFEKMQVQRRTEAIALARQLGWIK
ncbi:LuxR family transcriptional regulator [Paenibacillus nanensis]|uniref:LuxR family transcriptional regulator n=1 Tax=Paenibacillus nanensis TaxID=393251 RepID=A0A3A1V264_9BACL|nr:LuxR C-terminal-related transcriptional regulator [Paenibacillus nanensis]RIX53911.1 LuxR family transcriptional regulator [Paenibacillus nanensis]